MTTRCLVTNDDGVHSEGLRILADAARIKGMEVTVVAPAFDASGSSASMTVMARDGEVLVDSICDGTAGRMLSVQGPPAFIVRAAMYGAFGGRPDVVLSGVNRGLNTGRAVLHSGTVCAALTAANYGARGLAVSATVDEADDEDGWAPARTNLGRLIDWLMATPEATVLNANVPASGGRTALDVRPTQLSEAGTVQGSISELTGGLVPVTFDDHPDGIAPGTDAAALADGCISVTAIRAVTEDLSFDLAEVLRA